MRNFTRLVLNVVSSFLLCVPVSGRMRLVLFPRYNKGTNFSMIASSQMPARLSSEGTETQLHAADLGNLMSFLGILGTLTKDKPRFTASTLKRVLGLNNLYRRDEDFY